MALKEHKHWKEADVINDTFNLACFKPIGISGQALQIYLRPVPKSLPLPPGQGSSWVQSGIIVSYGEDGDEDR